MILFIRPKTENGNLTLADFKSFLFFGLGTKHKLKKYAYIIREIIKLLWKLKKNIPKISLVVKSIISKKYRDFRN